MSPAVELVRAAPVPPGSPGTRTYCFAHAGGDPRAFLAWQDALDDVTELVAVVAERGHDLAAVADRAAAEIAADGAGDDRPTLLFGHSLGAVVAFEVARLARGRVTHLVASGCAAPGMIPTPRMTSMAAREGQDFADAVGFYGGLHPDVVADPDIQEIMLPAVHADFRMVAGYRYHPADPLTCDVTLVNGTGDPSLRASDIDGWWRETARPPATHWVDGGHFYFDDRPETAVEVIRRAVGDIHVELI